MIQVSCTACGKLYRVPEQFAGKKTRCKNCSAIILIPEAPAPEPAPEEKQPVRPVSGKPKFPTSGKPSPKTAGGKKFAVPKKTFGSPKFARTRAARGAAAKPQAPGGEEEAGPAGGTRQMQFVLLGGAAVLVAVLLVALGVLGFLPWPFAQPKAPPKLAKRPAAPEAVEKKEGAPAKAEAAPSEAAAPELTSIAAPNDPFSLVPARAEALAYIAFGRFQNLPLIGEELAKLLKDDRIAEFVEATSFDPLSNLESVWLAAEVQPSGESKKESWIAILDGSFEKETFLNGLEEKSIITGGPRAVSGLEVYAFDASSLDIPAEEAGECYVTFLSERRVLLGEADFFNEAIKLRSRGENIRANKLFASLTGDFSTEKVAWLAMKVPKGVSLETMLSGPSGLGPFPGLPGAVPPGIEEGVPKEEPEEALEEDEEKSAETPSAAPALEFAEAIPSLDAVFFSLDSGVDGSLKGELALRGASPEEGAKTRKLLASLMLSARVSVPKEFRPFLDAIKFESQKETVRVRAALSPDLLEKIGAMLQAAEPDLEPGEEPEEEEPEMESEEETEEFEESAEEEESESE